MSILPLTSAVALGALAPGYAEAEFAKHAFRLLDGAQMAIVLPEQFGEKTMVVVEMKFERILAV